MLYLHSADVVMKKYRIKKINKYICHCFHETAISRFSGAFIVAKKKYIVDSIFLSQHKNYTVFTAFDSYREGQVFSIQ